MCPRATEDQILEKAHQYHKEFIVVDAHHDILMDVLASRDAGLRGRLNEYWAPKLNKGGVKVQFFPIYVDTPLLPELGLRTTLRMAEAFNADLEENSTLIAPAKSYQEIKQVVAEGKIAAVLAIEGVDGFGNDLDLFHTFYRMGVREISLTWNRRNSFADGTGEQETRSGLTKLGFAAIKEMNRLNILVDVSHINQTCFFDVLNTTTKPVIASHSDVKAIYDHPRNLSDDQIRALAANGGVMGLLLHPGILDPKQPNLSRAVDHIAYVADLVGIDHIGLGPDFMEDALASAINIMNPGSAMMAASDLSAVVENCGRSEELPNLTAELIRRGFSEEDIRKILGENFLRIYKQVLVD